ncbi:hypothetical protein BCR33DRAFT_724133 [Rhizoclosmatium globosum]|uniref:Uncharacterized protein n=1 Tax=Rhizoclosmatium globosum TaxID=329046 RepID=A0A1Y2B7T2_9FUNG|nr:hypothetical protein BCR33DRAFT_724133 [Rhizoclosmatium globosum]|eukprot:ORY30901.1 hypothetical protein BCR33DRAFT_724133 [Rhizoclosmatium globosum]
MAFADTSNSQTFPVLIDRKNAKITAAFPPALAPYLTEGEFASRISLLQLRFIVHRHRTAKKAILFAWIYTIIWFAVFFGNMNQSTSNAFVYAMASSSMALLISFYYSPYAVQGIQAFTEMAHEWSLEDKRIGISYTVIEPKLTLLELYQETLDLIIQISQTSGPRQFLLST